MTDTALTVANDSALARPETLDVAAFYHEQFLSGEWKLHDLTRVRVPSGGGRTWEIPDELDPDEPISAPVITGVILASIPSRIRYHDSFEDRGEAGPPDCLSNDMLNGYGKPYPNDAHGVHSCGTCPANQFGSGKSGRGKACNERRHLLVLAPELGNAPIHIDLGPTSIKPVADYRKGLLNKLGLPVHRVLTEIRLTQKESGGIRYAVPSFRYVDDRPLSAEDQALVDGYRNGDPSFIELCRQSLLNEQAYSDDD